MAGLVEVGRSEQGELEITCRALSRLAGPMERGVLAGYRVPPASSTLEALVVVG
jgi:hypothetical protein